MAGSTPRIYCPTAFRGTPTDLFLSNFRGTPTPTDEGLGRVGGSPFSARRLGDGARSGAGSDRPPASARRSFFFKKNRTLQEERLGSLPGARPQEPSVRPERAEHDAARRGLEAVVQREAEDVVRPGDSGRVDQRALGREHDRAERGFFFKKKLERRARRANAGGDPGGRS